MLKASETECSKEFIDVLFGRNEDKAYTFELDIPGSALRCSSSSHNNCVTQVAALNAAIDCFYSVI